MRNSGSLASLLVTVDFSIEWKAHSWWFSTNLHLLITVIMYAGMEKVLEARGNWKAWFGHYSQPVNWIHGQGVKHLLKVSYHLITDICWVWSFCLNIPAAVVQYTVEKVRVCLILIRSDDDFHIVCRSVWSYNIFKHYRLKHNTDTLSSYKVAVNNITCTEQPNHSFGAMCVSIWWIQSLSHSF